MMGNSVIFLEYKLSPKSQSHITLCSQFTLSQGSIVVKSITLTVLNQGDI